MSNKKINVAIIGLGFGAEFIPIYKKHPNANLMAICQRTKSKLDEIGNAFDIEKRFTDYDQLLKDPDIDAVHINTPIPDHAIQSIKALKAGKHVACTVPMATTVAECEEIVKLTKANNLTYMMMETVVYAREFLFMKELYEKGELGKIQFLKASHQQDMDGWPNYWPGLPPMHYATHCVGPVLGLLRAEAEYVSCFGSGTIREDLQKHYNSPYAVETAHIKLRNSDVSAHVYRSLFDVARQYRESFEVYGSKKSVEWPLIEGHPLIMHVAKRPEPEIPEEVECPDYAKFLPEPIQRFTTKGVYDSDEHQHLSFTQGAGHGGSHPHLVHEFLSALIQNRNPYPNATQSANITCVGLLAHQSAQQGGAIMKLPAFTLS
ncbi:Gfo/Idh/MocA family oxidoreductase [Chryseolinea sp. H1M3-3]|uniref:Gfo/Idh/MocA family protein n=1 Tax=Chryseolinea sp. H1M3-3 TaxID=3034144 RepID=UPI0023ED6F7D|nr:Gfo/Idh/MocA family oxidoreductase [Chryseolinea sp. H1M3-3]